MKKPIDGKYRAKALFPAILTAGYVLSFVQYRLIKDTLIDPYNSIIDFKALAIISVLNIAFLTHFRKRYVNIAFLIVQLILLLMMITIVNSNLTITVLLSPVYLLAAGYYLKRPANMVFSAFASVAILFFQQSIWIDSSWTPTIDTSKFLMLCFLFFIIVLLSHMISSILESHESVDELIERQKGTIISLIETNVGIQKYALDKKEEFEKAERLRITRDIHDTIGYVLTNNIMLLRACSYYVPKRCRKAQSFIDDALQNAQGGLNETRDILRKLRDIDRIKGIDEIAKIVKLFRESTGIDVKYDFGNTAHLWGSGLDYTFYRIIQEGLVNSVKHGKATAVSISFWQTDTEILLNISDNGSEQQEGDEKKGIGLQGMEERISRFGGKLEARRYPHGFTILITIPLKSIAEEEKSEKD